MPASTPGETLLLQVGFLRKWSMFSNLMRKKVSVGAVLKRGGLAYEIGLLVLTSCTATRSVTLGNKFNFAIPVHASVNWRTVIVLDGRPRWLGGEECACQCRSPLGWEDPLEKELAAHSSILVWEIPWTEETCGPQPMGSRKSQTQLSN